MNHPKTGGGYLAATLRFFLLVFFCLLPIKTTGASTAPNFVVVFIDDLGWGDFSCFGNTTVKTLHVDRLAEEGIRFRQFYVNSPICSPSRVALTTGQYPKRWQIHSFLNNRQSNQERGMAQWLDPQAPTLARKLKEAGYTTGHFGKWHMGGQRDVGEAPLIGEYGFDESLTNFEGLGPRLLPLCYGAEGEPLRKHALGSDRLGRGPIIWIDRARITEGYAASAVEFMKKAAADGKPFYVNVWPDDVHSPFFPPPDRRGDGSKRDLYHGVLKTMDEQLGVLFDFIRKDQHLRTNTVILLCSDNGPERGAGSAGPFRGTKATLYEGGIRSPLIVWAPGFIPTERKGTENKVSVFSAMDLVPSLLTLARVNFAAEVFDGQNVSDTLLGRSSASRKEPLFWVRPPDHPGGRGENLPDLAVREGRWKLLCEFNGSGAQLYDLEADEGEKNSLSAIHMELVTRLTGMVRTWYER